MWPVFQIHVGQILKEYWLERLSNYSPPELSLVLVHLFSWVTYLEDKPKLSGPLAVLKDPGVWLQGPAKQMKPRRAGRGRTFTESISSAKLTLTSFPHVRVALRTLIVTNQLNDCSTHHLTSPGLSSLRTQRHPKAPLRKIQAEFLAAAHAKGKQNRSVAVHYAGC